MSGLNTTVAIVERLTSELTARGLDLVQAFDVARYNDLAATHESLSALTQFGRPGALALLIGNTKALWPHFIRAYQASPDLQQDTDPLDRWLEDVVRLSTGSISQAHAVHFSHDTGAGFISMLHLAEVSGLAHRGPAHIGVHAEHGPWFGLRALVIVDIVAPELPQKSADPCKGCSAPCVKALKTALSTSEANEIASAWEAWVEVRDVCPTGQASRYGEDQILYHYTKDTRALNPAEDTGV